jgi:protoporphyrinogen/coproporphyrinogen III oxidase
MMKQTAIVGGGVSGLAIAYALQQAGMASDDLVVLEKMSVPGGNVRTESVNGYTIEKGPNGFLDDVQATLTLIDDLEIESVLPSNQNAARRFIWRAGKLREIKPNPLAFMTSGVLPLFGALRVALEPFQKKGHVEDESVYDFVARRIGKSAAEILVAAMVQGVFAGDAQQLELKSAFPKMYAAEQRHGSLVKAMIAKSRMKKRQGGGGGPAGPGGKLTSFDGGMQTLPDTLAAKVKSSLRLNCGVSRIGKKDGVFVLTLESGETVEAKTVVCASPAWAAAKQLQPLHAELSTELSSIQYPAVAVVATGFDEKALPEKPDGFGFLVPRGQGVRALGCLWTSSVWRHRAPDGKVLLRTMVGGSVDSDAAALSDDELIASVLNDLKTTMHITDTPELVKVYRHPESIAQYTRGHSARVQRIENYFTRIDGLYLSGSSYGGISVNHCIEEAPGVASAVLRFLEK